MGKKSRMLATGSGEEERIKLAIERKKQEEKERIEREARVAKAIVQEMIKRRKERVDALFPIVSKDTPDSVTFEKEGKKK